MAKVEYLAIPLTADAKRAHPMGVSGKYATVDNMVRFGLRKAHPGQYRVFLVDYYSAMYRPLRTAYVRV